MEYMSTIVGGFLALFLYYRWKNKREYYFNDIDE